MLKKIVAGFALVGLCASQGVCASKQDVYEVISVALGSKPIRDGNSSDYLYCLDKKVNSDKYYFVFYDSKDPGISASIEYEENLGDKIKLKTYMIYDGGIGNYRLDGVPDFAVYSEIVKDKDSNKIVSESVKPIDLSIFDNREDISDKFDSVINLFKHDCGSS